MDNKNYNVNFFLTICKKTLPPHDHVTEICRVKKQFLDCGGFYHETDVCMFQIWTSHDYDHRMYSDKLCKIIEKAESLLHDDLEVEVEYGNSLISLSFLEKVEIHEKNILFFLSPKQTDCLAPDKCGISQNCC